MTTDGSLKTLVGDLAAWCTQEIDAGPDVDRIRRRAYDIGAQVMTMAVRELVGELEIVPAILESVTVKDGVKATLKPVGANRLHLAEYVGQTVSVLLAPEAGDVLGPVNAAREVQLDLMGSDDNGQE